MFLRLQIGSQIGSRSNNSIFGIEIGEHGFEWIADESVGIYGSVAGITFFGLDVESLGGGQALEAVGVVAVLIGSTWPDDVIVVVFDFIKYFCFVCG